jgi:hypothetical protein
MKNRCIYASVLSAFAFLGTANAQTSGGNLGVSANVQGSINLTFVTDSSGIGVTGTTTSTASLPFSNVQMYGGSVPTNVTKTLNGITSFALATPFDVRVDIANSASANYALTALLATPDATNVWTIGATDISAGVTASTLTSTGAYTTAVPYTLKVVVPASEAAGSVSNSIGFTATAN